MKKSGAQNTNGPAKAEPFTTGEPETQTVRRLRPLARRAPRTLQPLRVCMRARKPWVRLRLRLLG